MRQSLRTLLKPLAVPFLVVLAPPLVGCAGFGNFNAHTFDPLHRPYVVASNATENVALAHGKQVQSAELLPKAGQPWPTAYPMDPTIMDIERAGTGVP